MTREELIKFLRAGAWDINAAITVLKYVLSNYTGLCLIIIYLSFNTVFYNVDKYICICNKKVSDRSCVLTEKLMPPFHNSVTSYPPA